MTRFPEYSLTLLELASAHDRVRMSVHASTWLMDSLAGDEEQFTRGDGSLSDFADVRLRLLEEHTERMGRAVDSLIIAESKPHFEVVPDPKGGLKLPEEVSGLLAPFEMPVFFYHTEEEALAKAATYSGDHHLIFWEGDCHAVPKHYPASFIELWWPRIWCEPMVLDVKPPLGWSAYGHEL